MIISTYLNFGILQIPCIEQDNPKVRPRHLFEIYHTNSPKIREIFNILQQTQYRSIHGSLDKLYSSEINSLIDLSLTPLPFQGRLTPRLLSICLLKSPTFGENWCKMPGVSLPIRVRRLAWFVISVTSSRPFQLTQLG